MSRRASLRSIAAHAAVVVIVLGSAAVAVAASSDPVVKLKTETEKEALAKGRIAARVEVVDRSRVRLRAKFSAGVSGDFLLDPQTKPVGRHGATFQLPLSEKQRRVLAAAIDACAEATVTIRARALDLPETPVTRGVRTLQRPRSC